METSLPTFLNKYKLVQSSFQLQLEIESLTTNIPEDYVRKESVRKKKKSWKNSVCSFWMSCKYESIDAFFHFHFRAMLKSGVCVSHTYTNVLFWTFTVKRKFSSCSSCEEENRVEISFLKRETHNYIYICWLAFRLCFWQIYCRGHIYDTCTILLRFFSCVWWVQLPLFSLPMKDRKL